MLEGIWQSYVKRVYPDGLDVRSIQYRETRRAFMAGAYGLLTELRPELSGVERESTAYQYMDMLQAELEAFAVAVKEGKE